tara:strand:- start:74 stop:337 length:264 start_codon:yes stop_codon:yes gene_type:complete
MGFIQLTISVIVENPTSWKVYPGNTILLNVNNIISIGTCTYGNEGFTKTYSNNAPLSTKVVCRDNREYLVMETLNQIEDLIKETACL